MVTAKEAIDRMNRLFGSHPGTRALHAKGEFYAGTFTANEWAAERCRAGHLTGDTVPLIARFSNGGGHPRAGDSGPDVRGFAVSITLPDGTATDLVMQTSPRFTGSTPDEAVEAFEAFAKPALRVPGFLLKYPKMVPVLVASAKAKAIIPGPSYAAKTYFAIHAYRWIAPDGTESWVRYRLTPASSTKPAGTFSGRDRLRDELRARVEAGPVGYTLEVQVAAEGDDPHDPMSVWKSAWQQAGTIQITELVGDPEADGNIVVFDPTRIVDGIELSDDPVLHFRAKAYSESASRRAGGK